MAAGIIFHTSISLVTVTMFVRCFPKISTSSFPDLAGILHSAVDRTLLLLKLTLNNATNFVYCHLTFHSMCNFEIDILRVCISIKKIFSTFDENNLVNIGPLTKK